MALTDSNGGNELIMPVQPLGSYGYGGGGFGGFGGDWGSLIVLFLIAAMFGGFGGGWGMGMGGFGGGLGIDFPWLMNGQQGINNNVSDGFRDAQLHDSVTSVRDGISSLSTQMCSGFGNVSTQLCNGFNGVNMSVNNAQNALTQQMYADTIASLERDFNSQTAITGAITGLANQQAECCCENRLATANLGSDIAREACATRTSDTQNTQVILNAINDGFRQMSDQRYQDKIDAKNDEIAQLRQENLYARGQASQIAQNSTIIDGIYNRLNQCPVGTVPVYGEQPIFTCNNGGCGCGNNF